MTTKIQDGDDFEDLVAELFAFQLRRAKERRRFQVAQFSVSGAHVLLHIDAAPNSTNKTIAAALSLDETTVSRTVSSLVKKGYVTKVSGERDRRERALAVTDSGKHVLDELDRSQAEIVATLLRPLDAEQEEKLCSGLKAVSDAFGESSAQPRLADYPVTFQIRRRS